MPIEGDRMKVQYQYQTDLGMLYIVQEDDAIAEVGILQPNQIIPYEKKETIELKGEIPSPLNMPPGCPFGNRCPFCTDVCKQSVPELKAIGDNHEVACVRYQKGEIS